jgi:hypothetical protein
MRTEQGLLIRDALSENARAFASGVLRFNGQELLFGEAKRLVANKSTPLANLCKR